MSHAWELEKARNARHAAECAAEMEAAIETLDRDRFLTAYQKSFRFMKKRVRSHYYLTFLMMSSANQ